MTLGPAGAAVAATGVALAVSAAGAALAVRVGPVDTIGRRTAHRRPTPTSGGVAMLAAVALGLGVDVLLGGPRPGLERVGLALLLAGAAGAVGAVDDMADLDARAKLLMSVGLALAFTALAGPPLRLPVGGGWAIPLAPAAGLLGGALWIVTASNAVNFMDGANGLAAGALAVAFAALACAAALHGAPALAVAAACGAAACAGFLPFNLAGRLFQGDAGALFAAFLFAALCLAGAQPQGPGQAGRGPVGLYFGPIALMPFLADVLLTLLARAHARKRLLDAHSEHLYQLWLHRTGRGHLALAWRGALVMAAAGALAVGASLAGETAQAAALVLSAAASALAWAGLRARLVQAPLDGEPPQAA